MELQRLSLTNFRAFKQAEFEFKPGMNLIVGINGVGKSSVLDAIRVMLSHAIPQISDIKCYPQSFDTDDITVDDETLIVSIDFANGENHFTDLARVSRQKNIPTSKQGDVRVQSYNMEDQYKLSFDTKTTDKRTSNSFELPLAVYYSTSRSVSTRLKQLRSRRDDPRINALISRELQIRDFAAWWLAQNALMKESRKPVFGKNMSILSATIASFLETVDNLTGSKDPTTLYIKKHGKKIDIAQMSDGERGIIALVLDLARRLAQTYPKLDNPLKDGRAVVLIDELDLHLHPRWQRDITKKLTETFPGCQFIATTHSPQIVSEVEPEKIIILDENISPYRPDQSLGMDTNWILRHLMGTDELPAQTKKEYERISKLIEKEEYDKAESLINKLRKKYGETPELVRLQTRIDSIRILGG